MAIGKKSWRSTTIPSPYETLPSGAPVYDSVQLANNSNFTMVYGTQIRRPRQTQGGARQGIRQAKTSKFRHTTTRSSNLAAGTAGTIADELLVKIQKLSTVPAASVAVRATAAVLPEAAFLVSCSSSSSNQFFAKIQSRREFYCREVFRRLRAAAAVQQLAASQQPPAAFNSS